MKDLERISSAQWSATLLKELEILEGFHELLEHWRSPEPLTLRLASQAEKMLARYTKEDLRVARLHYNTHHLIGFWRFYFEHLQAGISNGQVSRSFPLISATTDPVSRRVTLGGVSIHQMKGGLFIKKEQSPQAPSFERVEFNHEEALLDSTLSRNSVLDSLYGRLTLVAQSFFQTSVILYQMFLARERQADSSTWAAYKIHVFLDTFMYCNRTSRFDLIFFANNRLELMIWLDSSLKAHKLRSLEQAELFLKNQTQYYQGLSQRITLEENEVLNTHRELLHYDEILNVVRLGKIPTEIFGKCHEAIQDLGITSQGCPVSRAKGVNINALTEIYQYSDHLFLCILEASWEFKHLFNQEKPV